jgi:hypothetical protein
MQVRNAEMVRLLSADLQLRYEPNFAWKSAVSAFLALPALRAFWPMSSVDYTAANRGIDLSGQGNHLTDNNTVEFGYDSLAPYVHCTATNTEFLSRADGGAANWADITGTEVEVLSAYRGLTMGSWVYFDGAPGVTQYTMSKCSGGGAATTAYSLHRRVGGTMRFTIGDGIVNLTVSSTSVTAAATWYFVVGRFIPSTAIRIFLNSETDDVVAAVPAAIQDIGANFYIGQRGDASSYFDGRVSMAFLCAAQLSDAIIFSLFEQTRAMYGV